MGSTPAVLSFAYYVAGLSLASISICQGSNDHSAACSLKGGDNMLGRATTTSAARVATQALSKQKSRQAEANAENFEKKKETVISQVVGKVYTKRCSTCKQTYLASCGHVTGAWHAVSRIVVGQSCLPTSLTLNVAQRSDS